MSAKKTILAIIAVVMLCAICISGTVAYLTQNSGAVKNTFTFGGGLNELSLLEHTATLTDGVYTLDSTTTSTGNNYTAVYPGVNIPKDPYVTVTGTGTTSAYLFIEVVETELDAALVYSINSSNWTATNLTPQHGGTVYVYAVNSGKVTSTSDPIYILTDNQITIASDADLTSVDGNDALTFYSYLIQTSGFASSTAAWEAVFPTSPTP